MMKRSLTRVLNIFGGAALVLLAAGALGAAAAATLRSEVLVDSDTVRLGDVFQDAGGEADKVIATAPAPGRKLVLEATWLYRVARAYRVAWRPASRLDRTVVKRASNIIPASRIAAILSSELRRRLGENEKLDIEFDNRAMRIYLPASLPASVKMRTMDIDRQDNRFAAILVAPDNRPGAVRMSVSGQYHRLVEVPVVTHRMRPGDRISKGDLDWITVRAGKLDRNALLNPTKIVGMSPRRVLVPDKPIRAGDIRLPILVEKGSVVTLMFRTARMTLSARGKAIQSGSKGDTIRVRNTDSKKVVDAVVTASGEVSVVSTTRTAMN